MAESKETKAQQVKIQIQSDEETKSGSYCNTTFVRFTHEEFVTDFMYVLAQPPYGKLHSRIVMSPGHIKRLAKMLNQNIAHYEQQFGAIKEATAPPQKNVIIN